MTDRILRPSSAPRWGNCPGSYVLEGLYPEDETTPKAREGTAGHFYVTEALQGRVHPVGALAPNGHPIDQEMVDCADYLLVDVAQELALCGENFLFRVETMVTMHGLVHELNEGTPDVFLIDPANRRVVLWDYKYGHRPVDPFQNEQLVDYLAGVFEALELTAADVSQWTVSLRIVQPRNYRDQSVRRWDTSAAYAWGSIAQLSRAAQDAMLPNAPTQTGPWCRDCSARAHCPAARMAAGAAMDYAATSTPMELDAQGVGVELRLIALATKRLDARRTGLEAVALAKIQAGENVPYWSREQPVGREQWSAPAAEVIAFGQLMGHDLRKALAVITPVQARKLGLDAAVVAAYTERPLGEYRLTPVDENAAAKVFGQ